MQPNYITKLQVRVTVHH